MLVARELSRLPGIADAAVVMGTEANKGILKEAEMLTKEAEAASPNDLVIAVRGESAALFGALVEAEKLLARKQTSAETSEYRPKTLRAAVKSYPSANLAVISVAGRYATDEAWDALRSGLHVLLFSDNVSLDDEIALKRYAASHGLLLMGPGAGTAILNGVGLGFANAVPAGPVGIVSAAGTGLQEVSTLLARRGVGLTQGIGTGGRDLKEDVGGMMMLAGLQALQADTATQLIILVSKPPAASVARKILEQVSKSEKPVVVCLLGGEPVALTSAHHRIAHTLEEAAALAAGYITNGAYTDYIPDEPAGQGSLLRKLLKPDQRYLRGLFSGGTLCYEAQVIWRELMRAPVLSNAPLEDKNKLPDSTHSQRHAAVDLGEAEFTVGRPHPMIDNDLRLRRLVQEARDPETAVIMMDVVLGFGAHPDPASELSPAIRAAQELASGDGRQLLFVASVIGTEADPQRLSRQVQALEQAGTIICPSNAAAARLAAGIVEGL